MHIKTYLITIAIEIRSDGRCGHFIKLASGQKSLFVLSGQADYSMNSYRLLSLDYNGPCFLRYSC